LARQFERPIYAQQECSLIGSHAQIFHLLWYGREEVETSHFELPRDALFRGVDVAFFRSAWDDPQAVYVGFKGGDNKANHSHLDLGTFVLDALGERWVLDLGSDDYNLPGYFGKQRWTYFRLRTEAHNTLTIDGENQNPAGKAPIVAFQSKPERAFAVTDLTGGYAPLVKQAKRGIALLDRRQVLVQDEVEAAYPVEVVWNFLTRARIDVSGAQARLAQGKAKLEARILSPTGARFEIISTNAPEPQAQQPDVHNLTVRLPKKMSQVRIAVLLSPPDKEAANPTLEPLREWIAMGKLGK
jgi:hypothetical protein